MKTVADWNARSPASGVSVASRVPVAQRWNREWTYFTIVVAAWCFTPLMRRIIDYRHGVYNPVQITSLIPFLLTLPLVFFAFRGDRLARMTRTFRVLILIWLAAFSYSFLIAVAAGNVFGALFAALQYLIPAIVGIWIVGQPIDGIVVARRICAILLAFGSVVAAYGLAQFASPPPWDALWVIGGQFAAVGAPLPFQMRIFSTLNSPGPAADFFAQSVLLALPLLRFGKAWVWPLITLLGAALLLTLVREAWIALMFGVAVYLVMSPRRMTTLPILGLFVIVFGVLIAFLPAVLGAGRDADVVTARVASIGDVDHDTSALARTREIQDSLQESLADPIGSGLGTIGSAAALSANLSTEHGTVLDSGYLARLVEMGWLGFTGYAIVLGGGFLAIVLTLFQRVNGEEPSLEAKVIIATSGAMCAALLWADAAGDAHLGLQGVFFWIAMGLGLRAPLLAASSIEAVPVSALRTMSMRFRRPIAMR